MMRAFRIYVGKNLSRMVAYRRFLKKKKPRDWRGFSYNKKTGYARGI